MIHLYPNFGSLMRGLNTMDDGVPSYSWDVVGRLWGRIDLSWRRDPVRDPYPQAVEAGRPPDRMGILFTSPDCVAWMSGTQDRLLRSADRFVCTFGPMKGTFELWMEPDQVQDFNSVHHYEIIIREVAQALIESKPAI
jgi:hypothetical protein